MATVRWTCSDTSGSWVTITTVVADLAVDVPHELEDLGARVGVELAGRLVGEEHLRLVRQGDRHGHALLLAAAEALGPMIRPLPQPDQREQLARAIPPRAAVATVEDHRQLDVLGRRQVGQQVARGLLPHEADDAAPVRASALGGPSPSGRGRRRWRDRRTGRRGRRGWRGGSTCRSPRRRRWRSSRPDRRAGRGPGARRPRDRRPCRS